MFLKPLKTEKYEMCCNLICCLSLNTVPCNTSQKSINQRTDPLEELQRSTAKVGESVCRKLLLLYLTTVAFMK